MKTAREILEGMDDPDTIGTSEYRTVWEHVENVISSAAMDAVTGTDAIELVLGSLEVLQASTRHVSREFQAERDGTELARQVTNLDAELDALVAKHGNDAYRHATELHYKVRRAYSDVEALPISAEQSHVHVMINALRLRLLVEVFDIKPWELS